MMTKAAKTQTETIKDFNKKTSGFDFKKELMLILAEHNKFIIEDFFHGGYANTRSPLKIAIQAQGASAKQVQERGDDFDYDSQDEQSTASVFEFEFNKEKLHVEFLGTFTSSNGLEYDYWQFVKPVPISKVEYVKV